jgi:hypothetical protein
MIIRNAQIEALDAIPLSEFLARVESAARADGPDLPLSATGLRGQIQALYQHALGMRLRTEREIAAFILQQLQNQDR